MSLSVANPWRWLQIIAETCRNASVFRNWCNLLVIHLVYIYLSLHHHNATGSHKTQMCTTNTTKSNANQTISLQSKKRRRRWLGHIACKRDDNTRRTQFWSENMKYRDRSRNLSADGRMHRKQSVKVWNGSIWLRIRSGSGILLTRLRKLRVSESGKNFSG